MVRVKSGMGSCALEPGEHAEYAVEVPGRGYANWTVNLDEDALYWVRDREDAQQLCCDVQVRFRSLGCPEIADSVRVVTRTLTVAYSDMRPLETRPKREPAAV